MKNKRQHLGLSLLGLVRKGGNFGMRHFGSIKGHTQGGVRYFC